MRLWLGPKPPVTRRQEAMKQMRRYIRKHPNCNFACMQANNLNLTRAEVVQALDDLKMYGLIYCSRSHDECGTQLPWERYSWQSMEPRWYDPLLVIGEICRLAWRSVFG